MCRRRRLIGCIVSIPLSLPNKASPIKNKRVPDHQLVTGRDRGAQRGYQISIPKLIQVTKCQTYSQWFSQTYAHPSHLNLSVLEKPSMDFKLAYPFGLSGYSLTLTLAFHYLEVNKPKHCLLRVPHFELNRLNT